MTGITKDELMQMARDAGLISGYGGRETASDELLQRFANAIMERAAVEANRRAEEIKARAQKEQNKVGAMILMSGANGAMSVHDRIRALKINTGD